MTKARQQGNRDSRLTRVDLPRVDIERRPDAGITRLKKGAANDGIGSVTGNRWLEREGEMENAEGRARQAANNVFD